jgi:hypothetical protein
MLLIRKRLGDYRTEKLENSLLYRYTKLSRVERDAVYAKLGV